MHNKVCLVTGATSGIGKVTARELAQRGAQVLLVARNAAKAEATVKEIQRSSGNQQVDYLLADLSSFADIQNIADEVERRVDRLHVLVNNAGAYFHQRQESIDGYEQTWALNHLNYFLLTALVFELLHETGTPTEPARIINVASGAHFSGRLDFDDLQGRQNYSGWRAYAQSKLANVMFTYELAQRIGLKQPRITVNTLHPGFVATNFASGSSLWSKVFRRLMDVVAISAEQGAQTSIYLATSTEVRHITSNYFDRCRAIASSQWSYRRHDQQRLWNVSEEQVGRSFQPERFTSPR